MNHTPSLGRAWRKTFWAVYDHLGLIVILSLIWPICIFTIFLAPAGTSALYHIAHLIICGKEVNPVRKPQGMGLSNGVKIKDFFYVLPKYFIKSTFLVLTFIAVSTILLLNISFYISHLGVLGFILAGISFWLLLLVCLMSIYVFPLLCIGKGYKEIMQYSLLLVLNNIKFSLKFALSIVILLVLEILLPIIGIGILAVFSQEAFFEVQARYDKDIKITEPRRTFKELLRPWEFS